MTRRRYHQFGALAYDQVSRARAAHRPRSGVGGGV